MNIPRWRHLFADWDQYVATEGTVSGRVVVDDRVPLGLAVHIGTFTFACSETAESERVLDAASKAWSRAAEVLVPCRSVSHIESQRDNVTAPGPGTALDDLSWLDMGDSQSWRLDGVLEDATRAVDEAWGAAVQREGFDAHAAVTDLLDAAEARLEAVRRRIAGRLLAA